MIATAGMHPQTTNMTCAYHGTFPTKVLLRRVVRGASVSVVLPGQTNIYMADDDYERSIGAMLRREVLRLVDAALAATAFSGEDDLCTLLKSCWEEAEAEKRARARAKAKERKEEQDRQKQIQREEQERLRQIQREEQERIKQEQKAEQERIKQEQERIKKEQEQERIKQERIKQEQERQRQAEREAARQAQRMAEEAIAARCASAQSAAQSAADSDESAGMKAANDDAAMEVAAASSTLSGFMPSMPSTTAELARRSSTAASSSSNLAAGRLMRSQSRLNIVTDGEPDADVYEAGRRSQIQVVSRAEQMTHTAANAIRSDERSPPPPIETAAQKEAREAREAKEVARTFVSQAAAALGWSRLEFVQRIREDEDFRTQVHRVMSLTDTSEDAKMEMIRSVVHAPDAAALDFEEEIAQMA